MAPIRILLADDHVLMRSGLRALLATQPDFDLVAEAADGREAVERARESAPDIVLMDVSMPDLNGIDATARILAENPNLKVIGLSAHTDVHCAREMRRAGAIAYVLKHSPFEELVRAIRLAVAGVPHLDPGFVDLSAAEWERYPPTAGRCPRLTPREREILQLLAEGKTSKEIAVALCISPKTVDNHRQNIMRKLDLHSIAELTRYAIREGLTDPAH